MTKLSAASQPKTKDDPTIWVVDDELWGRMRPLLVVNKPRKKPGRPRSDDRAILNALIWLARTGAQWDQLPRVFPPKSTVNDRLAEWVTHGNLAAIWAVLLIEYDNRFGINWTWQAGDGCITKAPLGKKGLPAKQKALVPAPLTVESSVPSDTC
jgi:putative transposase